MPVGCTVDSALTFFITNRCPESIDVDVYRPNVGGGGWTRVEPGERRDAGSGGLSPTELRVDVQSVDGAAVSSFTISQEELDLRIEEEGDGGQTLEIEIVGLPCPQ